MYDEISDDDPRVDVLLDALAALRPVDAPFYPVDAREEGAPYIERHTIAGGGWAYTLWHAGVPVVINLDHTYQAVDAYLDYLEQHQLAFTA